MNSTHLRRRSQHAVQIGSAAKQSLSANTVRSISFNGGAVITPHTSSEFCSNTQHTTKYTFLSFLPKFLYEQFRKTGNIYFLVTGLLSMIDFISPFGAECTLVPLGVIIFLSACRELYEDYQRRKMDYHDNNVMTQRWNGSVFADTPWKECAVGDVIRVNDGEQFPADLMLLKTSNATGTCHIQTSNLDGETNPKVKCALKTTYNIDSSSYCSDLTLSVDCSSPNERTDSTSFHGTLRTFNGNVCGTQISMDQLLMRGCRVRQCEWVIGLVVFTGRDTKIMLNMKNAPAKRSHVEMIIDYALLLLLSLLGAMSIASAIFSTIWTHTHKHSLLYLNFSASTLQWGLIIHTIESFFTHLILLGGLVPISLYVTLEIVKSSQAVVINNDNDLRCEKTGVRSKARTSNLNEELGQIEYVFTDKTGTLTQNEMRFVGASIDGTMYNNIEDIGDARELLTLLSVCNTVFPVTMPEEKIEYNSLSSDELAFVKGVRQLQYFLRARYLDEFNVGGHRVAGETIIVDIHGEEARFEVLDIAEFCSSRKRMSVIARDTRDGIIRLYCKGADDVIRERLSGRSHSADWPRAESHLSMFASSGLRTLCCASREMTVEEFIAWHQRIRKSQGSLADEYECIESNLKLIGSTAIEDRLQDGVQQTMHALSEANIRVWMLTGDKLETAINVGRSCGLLTDAMSVDTDLISIDVDETLSYRRARRVTQKKLEHAWSLVQNKPKNCENVGLVISGKALGCLFPIRKLNENGVEIQPSSRDQACEKYLQKLLLRISSRSRAVIFCRVSPKQKSQVILLVKQHLNVITLAIGDGANDVPMIQAADIGVGLVGQEGLSAVRASDYALPQFRFLQRLVLVHGAFNYQRLVTLLNFFFYKCSLIVFCLFLFSLVSGFSGQIFFESNTLLMFNMAHSAFPAVFAAVTNQVVLPSSALVIPRLYISGQGNSRFNVMTTLQALYRGMIHATVLFVCGAMVFGNATNSLGNSFSLFEISSSVYVALVYVATLMVLLDSSSSAKLEWKTVISSVLSIVSVYVWLFVTYFVPLFAPDLDGIGVRVLTSQLHWSFVLLAVAMCMLPELFYTAIVNEFWPTDSRLVREAEVAETVQSLVVEKRTPNLLKRNTVLNILGLDESSGKSGSISHLGYAPFQDNLEDLVESGPRRTFSHRLRKARPATRSKTLSPSRTSDEAPKRCSEASRTISLGR